jgi:hypothetical protein
MKKFRSDESISFVEQLNSWSFQRDDLQRQAEQMKQKQANSKKKPLEHECAAVKSDYNWVSSLSLNCAVVESGCEDHPLCTEVERRRRANDIVLYH